MEPKELKVELAGTNLLKLGRATLHPPSRWLTPEDEEDAAAGIPWVLLDLEAYVADHRNATTAYSHSKSGVQIQVTFFLASPPQVSYFCVFCPGRDHTQFPIEPKILAMDKNLVLLRIVVSPEKDLPNGCDLYIYQADGSQDGGPSLTRLQRPPGGHLILDSDQVGLLSCGDDYERRGHGWFRLRSHHDTSDESYYVIAALCVMAQNGVRGQFRDVWFEPGPEKHFALFVYNSKLGAWSKQIVSLDQREQHKQPGGDEEFLHFNKKVIAMGGEGEAACTMAFVDLWRGMILCDVLAATPKLRYVPLPPPILPDNELRGDARLHRDIAAIEGRIKYVELQVVRKPSPSFRDYHYTNDGWVARTWSTPVAAASSCEDWSWNEDRKIVSSNEIDVNIPQFELLPRPKDDEGCLLPPLKGLAICHPALSLSHDDDTICFMNKIFPRDNKAWVIAVNLRTKKLLGVSRFAAERIDAVTFTYVHSRISEYLTGAPDTGESLKRTGGMLVQSISKKNAGPSSILLHDGLLKYIG